MRGPASPSGSAVENSTSPSVRSDSLAETSQTGSAQTPGRRGRQNRDRREFSDEFAFGAHEARFLGATRPRSTRRRKLWRTASHGVPAWGEPATGAAPAKEARTPSGQTERRSRARILAEAGERGRGRSRGAPFGERSARVASFGLLAVPLDPLTLERGAQARRATRPMPEAPGQSARSRVDANGRERV